MQRPHSGPSAEVLEWRAPSRVGPGSGPPQQHLLGVLEAVEEADIDIAGRVHNGTVVAAGTGPSHRTERE